MAKILVTGGAGFVGSHLCEWLLRQNEHDEVLCLDNFFTGSRRNVARLAASPRFELVRHDVMEPFVAQVEAIYHLACPASPIHYQRNPVLTLRTAVEGTRHMLDLARDVGAPILIASTSEIYGDPEVHPQPESYWGHVNTVGPRACYDEGKRCAEALAVAYIEQFGVDVRIARIFNTFGPRMHEDDGRVVSNFIVQALAGEPLTIYGAGQQTRSFCYVEDLIEGLQRLLGAARNPGPVNLGNPEEHTISELAHMVIELTGSSSELEHHPLPADDPARRRPDISKAQRLLGWSPRVDCETGLARTVAYFRERLSKGQAPTAAASAAQMVL